MQGRDQTLWHGVTLGSNSWNRNCGWRWETLELDCVVRGFVFVHESRFIDFGAKVSGQNLPLPTLPLLARITTAPIPARHWGIECIGVGRFMATNFEIFACQRAKLFSSHLPQ